MLDVNKQLLVIDVYVRYRVADRAQFVQSLGTEAAAKAWLSSIIMNVLGAQITATTWQEVLGSRIDAEGALVGTDFREQMRQQVLLAVFREVEAADPPLGLTVSEVKIKHLSFLAEDRATVYSRMRAEADLIARGLRADGEEEAASIRASADREKAAFLAEATQRADAIQAEGDALAIDMIIEAAGQVPELSQYVGSLEAYKLSRGLTSR